MMSIANVAVAAEAMVLGVKAGVDPKRLFEILSTSGGRSHHFLKRFPNGWPATSRPTSASASRARIWRWR